MFSYENVQNQTSLVPQATIKLSNPINYLQSSIVDAIVATGAEMTCIPELEIEKLGKSLAYSTIKVRDYNGNIKELKTYFINISIADYEHESIEVLAVSKEYALIGRDILNKYKVILDASHREWSLKTENQSIVGFFKYSFLGQEYDHGNSVTLDNQSHSEMRIAPINEFNVNKFSDTFQEDIQSSNFYDYELSFTRIVVIINWFLLIIGVISFCFIIYNSVYLKNAIASEIIYHAFSLILGWYGGLITSYIRQK